MEGVSTHFEQRLLPAGLVRRNGGFAPGCDRGTKEVLRVVLQHVTSSYPFPKTVLKNTFDGTQENISSVLINLIVYSLSTVTVVSCKRQANNVCLLPCINLHSVIGGMLMESRNYLMMKKEDNEKSAGKDSKRILK